MEKSDLVSALARLSSEPPHSFWISFQFSRSLSFSLTCPEALVVSLLNHCSSAHTHTHTLGGKKRWKERRRRRGRGDYL